MKIKKKTLEKIRNWFLILVITCVIGGLYRLYVEKDWFTIKEYSIIGVDDKDAKEIIPLLQKASQGTILFLFPRDKILSYSHASIVSEVTKVVPSRSDVIIRPTGLQTLTVEVQEFTPVMKISDTLGLTRDGVVFPTKRPLNGLPLFDSASSTVTFEERGFTFTRLSSFDALYLEKLSAFLEKISSVLFPVEKIAIDSIGDVRLFGQDAASQIMLTKDIDLEKGWSTLLSAIDTDPLKSSLEKEKNRLLYIDLRFGNKVFYKFGNNEEFQNGSSTVIIDDHVQTATTTLQ